MSALTARLSAVSAKNSTHEVMYSVDGAQFQEWACNRIDYKGSPAHLAIGGLVTDINNNRISVNDAKYAFTALLGN